MWRNYFSAALRNLFRNRAYAALNIAGLALGFTAAILIALYVRDEYSFDKFVPDADRIYRVQPTVSFPGRPIASGSVVASNIARALELDFREVEAATRLSVSQVVLRRGDVRNQMLVHWVDPNFFDFFPQKVLQGTLTNSLATPDGLVLTADAARRFFGTTEAVGRTLELNGRVTLRVAAVIENLPSNTHMQVQVFAPGVASYSALSFLDAQGREPNALRMDNVHTYIRLRPGARVTDLERLMRGFADRHVTGEVNGIALRSVYNFHFVPLREIHLQPQNAGDMKPAGDRNMLRALTAIAVLILFIAGSNFVSMMTARSARRAVEVGVRKTAGAIRRQVIAQFLAEGFFYSALALLVAMLAVELVLPAFNGFLQRTIVFDVLRDAGLAIALAGMLLLTGIAASAYPAMVLSSLRPVAVLKGIAYLPGGSSRSRQGLVIVQFSVLVVLVIATITVQQQTRYAMEERLKIPAEQIYVGTSGCTTAFRDAVAQSPGVLAASCAAAQSVMRGNLGSVMESPQGASTFFRLAPVDYDFMPLLGVKPVAGRVLSPARGEDDLLRSAPSSASNPSIVLNEAGARALGFATAQAAVGKSVRWSRIVSRGAQFSAGDMASSQIVGVVPDSSLRSVRDAVEPTAYYVDPSFFAFLVLKLDGNVIPQALREVRALWGRLSPDRPLDGMFLSQHLNDLYADIQRQSKILSAFAGVAIALAALGLLGLAMFTAERRTREIALRKVMGASRADILRHLVWQFVRPVLIANLIAWPVAWFLMRRWLEGFAYHVDLGPAVFVLASGVALLIALSTVVSHAMSVARTRPAGALRYE